VNSESDELEPCQKIFFKKVIKLRRNCVYTIAITNITEETMDDNEKIYFCFGDEFTAISDD
jgi:hypothetical protein